MRSPDSCSADGPSHCFLLGLGPLATFVAAAGGGLLGCWAFLLAGDRIAELIRLRRAAQPVTSAEDIADGPQQQAAGDGLADGQAEGADEAGSDAGRIRQFVDRYGVRGLGLVGPLFPGVTASVAGGLALGLDRSSLARWMTFGIITMYGLYVLGLAVFVYVF